MKYSEIISANRLLSEEVNGPKFNIAILSNIMVHQSKDFCEFLLRSESVNAEVTLGDFDNIIQDSEKFKNSDAVIIFWEACNFVDGLQYKIDSFTGNEFNNIVNKVKTEIDLVLTALISTPTVIINKFSSVVFDQMSLSKGNLNQLVVILNEYLKSRCGLNVVIFDIDELFARLSVGQATELRYYSSAKTLYSILFYKEYFSSTMHILLSALGKSKKALILDCDNTLWRGILGEDGFDGIQIYEEIQYAVLRLAKRGVIVGICSKNNREDVDSVLSEHPYMILRDEHIVIKKVGWENKASSLVEIAQELNIGIDSLVFVDDSSFEVGLIMEELPSVSVFQVSSKVHEHLTMMNSISNLFYTRSATDEDFHRVQMYKIQAQRSKASEKFSNIDDYLSSLEIALTLYVDVKKHVSRIAQMTQKTNQFNLTTKRYSETEIQDFVRREDKIVLSLSVEDKFGSSGVAGLAILCKTTGVIDSFLLSCRVLGRNIEYKFMDMVVSVALAHKITSLGGKFIRTPKNQQVENFYSSCGFDLVEGDVDNRRYCLDTGRYVGSKITYIKVDIGE